MTIENPELKVFKTILTFEQPFNLADVRIRCEREGITDGNVYTGVVDQMKDSGLIEYREVKEGVWGFVKK